MTVGVALVAGAALVLAGRGGTEPPLSPPPGIALTSEDRLALDTAPVGRGAPAPPAPAGVAVDDAPQVARAYLVAAHSVDADDAGRTHLRGAALAAPGSPAAEVGVLVLDAPAPGSVRLATVAALHLFAVDPGDRRRAYRAELDIATTSAGDGDLTLAVTLRDIVLARQPDGRWLVTADTPTLPDLPAGED